MRKKTFLRRNTRDYIRLGSNRSKLQKWRRPKGRDNKMRLKEKGRPRVVEIGYKTELAERGKVNGKMPIVVNNVKELHKIGKDNIVILGRMGMKKKLEIAKIGKERNIHFANFNINKLMKQQKNLKESKTK